MCVFDINFGKSEKIINKVRLRENLCGTPFIIETSEGCYTLIECKLILQQVP